MLYKFLRGLSWFYLNVFLKFDVRGKENIPSSGRAIICANHIHLFDPVAIAVNTKRIVSYLAKKELYKNRLEIWFFDKLHTISVQRDGNDAASAMKAMRVLKKEGILGIFPEGTRERGQGMLEFKSGAALLALKTNSPIIPAYIQGTYLPFSRLTLVFGKAIDPSTFAESGVNVQQMSEKVNKAIADEIIALKDSL